MKAFIITIIIIMLIDVGIKLSAMTDDGGKLSEWVAMAINIGLVSWGIYVLL